jgi:hypothetical protein
VDGESQGKTHPEHEASITRGFACKSLLNCTATCDTPVRLWPRIPGVAFDLPPAAKTQQPRGCLPTSCLRSSRRLRSARCPLRYSPAAAVCDTAEPGWFNGLCPTAAARGQLASQRVADKLGKSSPRAVHHQYFIEFPRYVLMSSAFQANNPGRARYLKEVGSR